MERKDNKKLFLPRTFLFFLFESLSLCFLLLLDTSALSRFLPFLRLCLLPIVTLVEELQELKLSNDSFLPLFLRFLFTSFRISLLLLLVWVEVSLKLLLVELLPILLLLLDSTRSSKEFLRLFFSCTLRRLSS